MRFAYGDTKAIVGRVMAAIRRIRYECSWSGLDENATNDVVDEELPACIREALDAGAEIPQRIDQRPGGCWIACLAMLSGLGLDDLPEGLDMGNPEREKKNDWNNRVMSALHEHGVTVLPLGTRRPIGWSIMTGKSPRNENRHSVIAYDGELWFDPHPSRAGIDGPPDDYEIVVPVVRAWILDGDRHVEKDVNPARPAPSRVAPPPKCAINGKRRIRTDGERPEGPPTL